MKLSSIVILFFCCSSVFAYDYVGVYKCRGHDPYLNKDYSGTLTVEQQNTVYKISMKYDTGETYRATGGPYGNELLSVVFQDTADCKRVGLEQYYWDKQYQKMGGFWVYLGEDKLGKEWCEKIKS